MADGCNYEKCILIYTKTEKADPKDFTILSWNMNLNDAPNNGMGDFYRVALGEIERAAPPGIHDHPAPESHCDVKCICRPIGKVPATDADFGPPYKQGVEVVVEVPVPGRNEPDYGKGETRTVRGFVWQRMTDVPGRCRPDVLTNTPSHVSRQIPRGVLIAVGIVLVLLMCAAFVGLVLYLINNVMNPVPTPEPPSSWFPKLVLFAQKFAHSYI